MLKNILKLGTVLNKSEQKSINGGKGFTDCHLSPPFYVPEGCTYYTDPIACVHVWVCDSVVA